MNISAINPDHIAPCLDGKYEFWRKKISETNNLTIHRIYLKHFLPFWEENYKTIIIFNRHSDYLRRKGTKENVPEEKKPQSPPAANHIKRRAHVPKKKIIKDEGLHRKELTEITRDELDCAIKEVLDILFEVEHEIANLRAALTFYKSEHQKMQKEWDILHGIEEITTKVTDITPSSLRRYNLLKENMLKLANMVANPFVDEEICAIANTMTLYGESLQRKSFHAYSKLEDLENWMGIGSNPAVAAQMWKIKKIFNYIEV